MDRQVQSAKQQFQLLLDRANKRFGKLRELQSGVCNNQWAVVAPYFNKTFESFAKLWAFQLSNRAALLESGLQRSDLGGIASKIGQLYYNYYLRSGDAGALLESYTFYDAIQTRQYFASNAGAPDPAAAARQLRFYARFIIVCLFLNRNQACVSSYALQFAASDAHDWQLVLAEVSSLVAAHVATPLPRSPVSMEHPYKPVLRCSPTGVIASSAPHQPRLREAILVSYRPFQVKVAELPLELYRMAQALEWQDQRLGGGAQPATAGAPGRELARLELGNPLMYKPTAQQLLSALLSVTCAVTAPEEELVLLYLAADAAPFVTTPTGAEHRKPADSDRRYMLLCPGSSAAQRAVAAAQRPGGGGDAAQGPAGTNQQQGGGGGGDRRRAPHQQGSAGPAGAAPLSPDCLLSPAELLVATRRRLLLVLDSDMGADFAALQVLAETGGAG
ncbi:hypothetical protein GPECTOR_49g553 [Gonium pectorale]|uniref:Uncharacterized protein n=1 Tax=Gonium pectorale TaxID=33097 RepID=A0A150G7Y7_GONPE|nr:hypothetical protein GPECTOR_49g553 [Gonium pectorale]|eukprot:KXZ45969.1 hypothetical protein GPECTOR_49g553 [Gonium pectorale]